MAMCQVLLPNMERRVTLTYCSYLKLVTENHIIYLVCALVWYPLIGITQIVCPLSGSTVDIHK